MSTTPEPLAAIAIRQMRRPTGATRCVVEQIDALRALQYRVVVLAERVREGLLEAHGAQWHPIPRWPINGLLRRRWFDFMVQRWAKRQQPALLISNGDSRGGSVLFMHNCVHLAEELTYGRPLPAGAALGRFHTAVLADTKYSILVANSELMRRDFIARHALPAERVKVIYPGFDPTEFNMPDHATMRLQGRQRLGFGENHLLVGLITSGDMHKRNVGFLLELAAHIEPTLADSVRFVIVGVPKNSDLPQQIEQRGLGHRVLCRPLLDNIASIYHALDIFVYPARIEEFGRVIPEALACGLPCLVSAHVGAAEIMQSEAIPAVISGYSLDTWAAALQPLLIDPQQRQAWGQLGSTRIQAVTQQTQQLELQTVLKPFRPTSAYVDKV